MAPPSCVEVRIEDADLRDAVDGKLVAQCGLANCLRTRPVQHAERLRRVIAHVRVNPRHAVVRVALDDTATAFRSLLVPRNAQAIRKRALDDVPRHPHASLARKRKMRHCFEARRGSATPPRGTRAAAAHWASRSRSAWCSLPSMRNASSTAPRLRSAFLDLSTVGCALARAHRHYHLCCPAALPILAAEPEPGRLRGRLATRANAELPEDRCDMVVDRPLGEHEPLGDLGVAEPLGDESEHLELTRSQPGGILLRRRAWPPGQPACAALAQAASNDGGSRLRAEAVQLVQSAPDRLLVVGIEERERGLIRRFEVGPQLGGAPPVACYLSRPRLARARRGLLDACAPAPIGQLADDPPRPSAHSEVESQTRRIANSPLSTREPCGL